MTDEALLREALAAERLAESGLVKLLEQMIRERGAFDMKVGECWPVRALRTSIAKLEERLLTS